MADFSKPIPPGLKRLLVDFTISTMVERPANLLSYAANYFSALRKRTGFQELLLEEEEGEAADVAPQGSYQRVVIPSEEIIGSCCQALEFFGDFPIFRSIEETAFHMVIANMGKMETSPGEVVVTQGCSVDQMYVIEEGHFYVFIHPKMSGETFMTAKFHKYGYFGETALIKGKPSSKTVISSKSGVLRTVPKTAFDLFLKASIHEKRSRYSPLLKRTPPFHILTSYERRLICDNLEEWCLKDGEAIIKEGALGNCVYIIESGKVDISRSRNSSQKKRIHSPIGWFSNGRWIGGIGGDPSEFTATAVGKVTLAILHVKSFTYLPSTLEFEVLHRKLQKCKY